MKILEITENEDGTATLEVVFEPDEIGMLLEYAVVDILKKQVEREKSNDICSGDN